MRGQEALMGPEGRLSANYQKIAVGGVFDLTKTASIAMTACAAACELRHVLVGSFRNLCKKNSACQFTFGCAPTTYWLELEYILTVSLNVPQDFEHAGRQPFSVQVFVWYSYRWHWR